MLMSETILVQFPDLSKVRHRFLTGFFSDIFSDGLPFYVIHMDILVTPNAILTCSKALISLSSML